MELQDTSAGSTQDERILAALAHAGVILPFWGLIGAIVIWATQREKSRFTGFQALQGATYQLVLVLSGFLCLACYMCSFFGSFLVMALTTPLGVLAAESGGDPEVVGGLVAMVIGLLTTFLPFCLLGLVALVGLAYVLYGLYGAVQVLQGNDFRYVIIGRRLEQYLTKGTTAT
jgi:uncharacterized Tic20 family protein